MPDTSAQPARPPIADLPRLPPIPSSPASSAHLVNREDLDRRSNTEIAYRLGFCDRAGHFFGQVEDWLQQWDKDLPSIAPADFSRMSDGAYLRCVTGRHQSLFRSVARQASALLAPQVEREEVLRSIAEARRASEALRLASGPRLSELMTEAGAPKPDRWRMPYQKMIARARQDHPHYLLDSRLITLVCRLFTGNETLKLAVCYFEGPSSATETPNASDEIGRNDPARNKKVRKSNARMGRRPDTDPAADRGIYEAWQTGHFPTYAKLGREKGISGREVGKAIDRHRKRPDSAA